jgi:hypothetical protein
MAQPGGVPKGPGQSQPAQQDSLGGLYSSMDAKVDAVISEIRCEQKAGGHASVMEMIPELHRPSVEATVKQSMGVKPADVTPEDFSECIALNWLAKFRLFHQLGGEYGLVGAVGGAVGSTEDTPIIALTARGSLLFCDKPKDDQGTRDMWYVRIREREAIDVPQSFEGVIDGAMTTIGRTKIKGKLETSVIAILAHPERSIDMLSAVTNVSGVFRIVGDRVVAGESGQEKHGPSRKAPE